MKRSCAQPQLRSASRERRHAERSDQRAEQAEQRAEAASQRVERIDERAREDRATLERQLDHERAARQTVELQRARAGQLAAIAHRPRRGLCS